MNAPREKLGSFAGCFAAAALAVGLLAAAGMLWRQIEQSKTRPKLAATKGHLKVIGLGVAAYEAMHTELPREGESTSLGWQVALLPYIDQQELHAKIDLAGRWDSPQNRDLFTLTVPEYVSPYLGDRFDASGYALSHYAGNVHVFQSDTALRLADLTEVIIAGEIRDGFAAYAKPGNLRDPSLGINRDPGGFGHPSNEGVVFLMGDGSVRWLSEKTSTGVLRNLATGHGRIHPQER